jgi:hypothetical protein
MLPESVLLTKHVHQQNLEVKFCFGPYCRNPQAVADGLEFLLHIAVFSIVQFVSTIENLVSPLPLVSPPGFGEGVTERSIQRPSSMEMMSIEDFKHRSHPILHLTIFQPCQQPITSAFPVWSVVPDDLVGSLPLQGFKRDAGLRGLENWIETMVCASQEAFDVEAYVPMANVRPSGFILPPPI